MYLLKEKNFIIVSILDESLKVRDRVLETINNVIGADPMVALESEMENNASSR